MPRILSRTRLEGDGHIEHSDWIGVVVASLTGLEGPIIPNLPSDEVPVGGYKYVRG